MRRCSRSARVAIAQRQEIIGVGRRAGKQLRLALCQIDRQPVGHIGIGVRAKVALTIPWMPPAKIVPIGAYVVLSMPT